MQAAEIELKFPVADVRRLRASALALGFEVLTERTFESNTLYDSTDRALRVKKQILRLRNYGGICTLTHKRKADMNDTDVHYKTRIETESEVQDCEAMAEVFAQLGYLPVFKYEKFRTELAHNGGKLVLDETPIGIWAELEGEPAWIDSMLAGLGIAESDCITDSYGKLFTNWKEETRSPAENLTFDEVAIAVAG
ncbi:class IV adenylate cyclase [Granulicella paludicola]|uniref:class IV adenylate cyclase n=1 Tax=Granulicella paludicola TaxID=474951 RepID=UPI0021DFD651|nr:class IV adenylate cyclase [Granulicella paludicola]